jgi:hypothetical protein
MKTLNFSILLLLLLLSVFTVQAARLEKKVYRSFPINKVQTLNLDNKYGNINISENRKDSVIIDVVIWVDGTNDKARRLLDKISVNINQSGNTVSAETVFDSNFSSNQEFSIDYNISVPADRELNVSQKYGNVRMDDLTGKGIFEIKYGELRAKNLLSSSLAMDISYSKVFVTSTKDLALSLKYSKLFLDKGNNFKLDTKYSTVEIGDGQNVVLDSKYDNIEFNSLVSLTVNSMYTGIDIEKLTKKLEVINGYGNISVGSIPAGFESIIISNKYAGIKLGIAADATYKLDGMVRYCNLTHPDGKFTNRMRENNSYEVHGVIGSSETPKSTVKVESNYGNVNLQQ